MEQIKDNKDVTNVLQILDNTVIRTNPFGANVTGDNSYRRAERISAALHLITNHIPSTEPIRTRIREGALGLLNLILDLRTGFRTPSSEKGQAVLAEIRALVSHVRLLAISGYISAQNANVVAEALDELGSLLTASQRSTLAEQVTISRSDLMPPVRESTRLERSVLKKAEARFREVVEPHQKDSSSARAQQVLDILKLGGTLGIKDIAANLPQFSEKMVQRELAVLVGSGKVHKTGEKRWSRYRVL